MQPLRQVERLVLRGTRSNFVRLWAAMHRVFLGLTPGEDVRKNRGVGGSVRWCRSWPEGLYYRLSDETCVEGSHSGR